MDRFDQRMHMLGWRVLADAVPEVEHVAAVTAVVSHGRPEVIEHRLGLRGHHRGRLRDLR